MECIFHVVGWINPDSLLRLLQHPRRKSRPARLMRSPESRAVVAVEVFVEGDVVAPERVVLESGIAAKDRAIPVRIQQENSVEAARQLPGDVP